MRVDLVYFHVHVYVLMNVPRLLKVPNNDTLHRMPPTANLSAFSGRDPVSADSDTYLLT